MKNVSNAKSKHKQRSLKSYYDLLQIKVKILDQGGFWNSYGSKRHKAHVQYRHLIPAPVDRTSSSVRLYKHLYGSKRHEAHVKW